MAALVARTLAELGRIDILVTAAGVAALRAGGGVQAGRLGPDAGGQPAGRAPVLPGGAARHDGRSGRGTIINVGSMVTSRTLTGSAAYTASKYGLLGFRRVLAEEMRPHGVRVGVLSAGRHRHAALGRHARGARPGAHAHARPRWPRRPCSWPRSASNAALEELTLLPAGGVL